MESTCQPGLIQVSEATRLLLPAGETLVPTGGIDVKGKGVMQTHVWTPPLAFFEQSPPQPSRSMHKPLLHTLSGLLGDSRSGRLGLLSALR